MKTKIIISLCIFAPIFIIVLITREVKLSSELSCFNSISSALNKDSHLISSIQIPETNGWYDLDAAACAAVVARMSEKKLIDCQKLNRENTFNTFFKIQVLGGTNGVYKVRVVAPGPDGHYGSSDDQFY